MKMILTFPPEMDESSIEELTTYLQEQNLAGIIIDRPEADAVRGSMGVGDYLPLIEILAGSTVAAATVKGIFDVIKRGMDLRCDRMNHELEQGKMDVTIEKPDGSKISLKFNALDATERANFSAFVEQAWQK